MPAKLSEGDTVGMTGEVTLIHDDGTVTLWLHGYDIPLTVRAEHLSLIAKKKAKPGRGKPPFDKPDSKAYWTMSPNRVRGR